MKPNIPILLCCLISLPCSVQAALIAHYTFDEDGTATVGSNATLGVNASISTTTTAVGAGSLALVPGGTPDTSGDDGAVSGNSFTWTSDTRSVAFWMQASGTQDTNATMISLGSGTGAGNRFDVRLLGGNLRLEVQSGGVTTTVPVGDGSWYHVTIALTDPATVASTQYFVHDSSAALVASGSFTGSTTAIATGTGPLRMGDSYQDNTRDFSGFLDDVRLYDNALNVTDAQALAQMWSPVPEPSAALLGGLGLLALLRRRRD